MRRKSPRVVWLPPTNQNSLGAGLTSGFQTFFVDAAGAIGDFAVGEIPLTIDGESDPLGAAATLSDVENSGYRLRRIVGKIWVTCFQADPANNGPKRVLVTAGIIVRRSDDVTGKSLASLSLDAELISPQEIRNFGDPWIWRRSWVLCNNKESGGTSVLDQGPTNNFTFGTGGNSDGPHVDAKTARLVGPEERLFLDVSSTVVEPGQSDQTPLSVRVVTDLRILASMRTSAGNRRNASR